MLLDKINGRDFVTELPTPVFSKVEPSPAIKDMKHAVIALVTSGGVVPSGNPDHLEALAATKFSGYSIDQYGGEDMPAADVAHGGYDPTFAMGHGNRVIPADALYEFKREGVIGDVFDTIYVTVGNGMPVDRATKFGDEIGKLLNTLVSMVFKQLFIKLFVK
jgi:glycine reductase